MNNKNSLKNIAKGASLILVGMFISKLIGYVYRLIIARFLGPDQYGLFTLSLAILGVLSMFATLGLPQGTLRFVSYYLGKKNYKKINSVILFTFKLIIPISIFFAIIVFLLSNIIAVSIFHNSQLAFLIKFVAILIPLTVLSMNLEMIIQAFQKIKYIVYTRNIIESLIKLVLTIFLFLIGFKIAGVIFAYTISIFATVLIFYYFIKKKIFPSLSIKKIILDKKEILQYSLPLLFSGILGDVLFAWADTLILGYFKPASQVGIYNAAVPTAQLLYVLPLSLMAIFMPIITARFALKQDLKTIFITVTKWIFMFNIYLLFFMMFFSRSILKILFGNIYAEGYLALIFLSLAFFIDTISFTSNNVLKTLEKSNLIFLNTLISSVLNIILNIIFIQLFGFVGAAYATAISLTLRTILTISEASYFTKTFPFKLNSTIKILSAIIISLSITKLISALISNFILSIITSLIISIILYLALILMTKTLSKDDAEILKSIQRKLKLDIPLINKIINRFT